MVRNQEKTKPRIHANTRNFMLALKELLDQRKVLDEDSFKLDKKLSRMQKQLSNAVSKSLSKVNGERKTYVPRCENELNLLDSIHRAMKPNKRMRMQDILTALEGMGYKTNSEELYTMVNNKLHEDAKSRKKDKITKLRRGVFVYKYRSSTKPKKRNSGKRRVPQAAIA